MSEEKNNVLYLNNYSNEEKDTDLIFKSYDDVDAYLTSNESYISKIRVLKEEKKLLEKMRDYVDTALYSLENDTTYLNHMKGVNDKLKKEFKVSLPISIASLAGTIASLYGFFATLDNIATVNNIAINLLCLGALIISFSLCFYYSARSIDHIVDIKQYEKEIKKYERRLNKKTIK